MRRNESFEVKLPEPIQSNLDRFAEQLLEALGEDLVTVVLYGDSLEGEFLPEMCDVNVMIVLTYVTITSLDRAAKSVQFGMREFRLTPLVLSEDELRRSTDVFPIKFLNMQRRHRILYGKDVLSELQISRDHLRLRCEQEIKNLMLRLHQFYLQRAAFPEQVENTLVRAVSPFIHSLGVLVELKTDSIPPTIDAVVGAADEFGLDAEPIRMALALKRGELQLSAEELKQLYAAFTKVTRQAAELADIL